MPSRYQTKRARLRFAYALRTLIKRGYSARDFRADLGAGATLGIVALPLSMALAIASGAPPQHGLFTAIVGGIIIALTGGSMHSVSGPTAAFVVLLAPITANYGLAGLMLASMMAGVILMLMSVLRFGQLLEFIPYPVTTGFTAGIGVVIAILQLGDLFGLGTLQGERIWERLYDLGSRFPMMSFADLGVGLFTLAALLIFPSFTKRIPAPLFGLLAASLVAFALAEFFDLHAATIGSRFGGIPAELPKLVAPWALSGDTLSLATLLDLLPSSLAIAALGAIESLLCAVVSDGMTGSQHDPDSELMGLGLGNFIVPFFGGFAATGAIARTATGIRAGGRTLLATVIHSIFLLFAMLLFAPALGYVPMAAMAALLLTVAWNMSDVPHFIRMLRISPRNDIIVLLACFSLTVIFDMVVSVSVGVVLAALLFMQRMVEITGASFREPKSGDAKDGSTERGVVHYAIAGPLFFGAAKKAMAALNVQRHGVHTVIMDLKDVPTIDATGMVALESSVERLNQDGIRVILTNLRPEPRAFVERARLVRDDGMVSFGSEDEGDQPLPYDAGSVAEEDEPLRPHY